MQVIREIIKFLPSGGSRGSGTDVMNKTLTTTDATATIIHAVPVAELQAVAITVRLCGMKSDATASYGSQGLSEARRAAAGNVTIVGTSVTTAREDSVGTPAISFVANATTQTVDIKCTGIAAETWYWEAHIEVTTV